MVEIQASFEANRALHTDKIPNIAYAGGSSRRKHFLKSAIPDISSVIVVGGGEEEDTRDVRKIMREKLIFAQNELVNRRQELVPEGQEMQLIPILAADTRTEIMVGLGAQRSYVSKNKPTSDSQTKEYFRAMSETANECGTGRYRVVSGSGAIFNEQLVYDELECSVILNQEVLNYLSTDDGYDGYLRQFESFYNAEEYYEIGADRLRPTDISAGISLPVLLLLGAINKIDGVDFASKETPTEVKYQALYGGLYTVALGFSPRVIASLYPQSWESVTEWDWLHRLTRRVLDLYEKQTSY